MEAILVLAIVLSFAIGATWFYWLLKLHISKLNKEHLQQIQKTIEELEKTHQSRMQATVTSLQEHYGNQVRQTTELLEKNFEIKILNLTQELEQTAKEKALLNFNLEKDKLENSFEEKYNLEFTKWKIQYENSIRQSSLTASRSAIKGSVSEQLLPLLPGLKYSPGDMRFIGAPIDYIIFDGYDEAKETGGQINAIIIADVKRGNRAKLSPIQLKIKQAVDAGNVRWETITIDDSLEISTKNNKEVTRKFQPVVHSSNSYNDVYEEGYELIYEKPQELCKKILAWGNSGKNYYISNLIKCGNHKDSNVRRLTASAIGKIALSNKLTSEIEQAIPTLGKLSQDEKPQVRQYAVKALGMINSEKVVGFLKHSLTDPVPYVSTAANISLQKLDLPF